MGRVIKSISVSEEINKHIENQRKEYGFDLSAWFNQIYQYNFMSIDGMVKEIEKKSNEINELKERINKAKGMAKNIGKILNYNEINFILKVPILIKDGKEWNAIRRRFNSDFNRDIELTEFQELVRQYDEDRDRKLKSKICFHKTKKR